MVSVQYMAIIAIIISNNAGKSSIATRVLTFNFDFSDWKFLLALCFFSLSFILSSFPSSFPILFFLIFLLSHHLKISEEPALGETLGV